MQYIFPADKQVELSFNVGIAGTSSLPTSVAVILEKGSTALSFAAVKNGEEWKATIDKPGIVFGTGEVKMSINVVLNNRLFTPVKSVAEIMPEVVVATPVPTPAPVSVIPEPVSVEVGNVDEESRFNVSNTMKNSVIEVKPELMATPKFTAADVTRLLKRTESVAPPAQVITPFRLQLLKTIEPGFKKKTESVITESKNQKSCPVSTLPAPASTFKLRKTKIVYK